MAKKYRLTRAALRLAKIHYLLFRAKGKESIPICLGCTTVQKVQIPSLQTGGVPSEVIYTPATQAQMAVLHEQGHPFIEEYDSAEEAAATLSANAPK